MPTVDPYLRRLAFADLGISREAFLATASPSSLCDDLDASDELRALERLPAAHRLDDVAVTFRRSVVDAAARPSRRSAELVVGCVALARRTFAELELAGEESPRTAALAGDVVREAELILRSS